MFSLYPSSAKITTGMSTQQNALPWRDTGVKSKTGSWDIRNNLPILTSQQDKLAGAEEFHTNAVTLIPVMGASFYRAILDVCT